MRKFVGECLQAPIGNDESTRPRRLYNNLLRGAIGLTAVIAVLLIAMAVLLPEMLALSVVILPVFVLLVLFACRWLNRRGAIKPSQRIFLGINFIAIAAIVFLYDGFTGSAVLLLLWPIVLGGVLVRPGFVFLTSVAASVVGLAAYLLQLAGFYSPPFAPPHYVHSLFALGSNLVLLNVLAAFIFMVIRNLNHALVRERVLGSELSTYRAQLEQMVLERTAEMTATNLELEREIAERIRVTAELRELEEFNEAIIQNVAEGVVVQDAQGHLAFANPAAASILGYTQDQLVGMHWTEIIPPEQHLKIEAADERRALGESDCYEAKVLRQDGARMPVLVSGSPRLDSDTGKFMGTMAAFTDIIELKRVEQEREQLLAAEREQRVLAETLRDVTLALTVHTSHAAVLDEILQQVKRVVPFCAADITMLEEGMLSTVRCLGYDEYGSSELVLDMVRSLNEYSYDDKVVESGRPVVIPDTHQDSRWLVFDETAWIRSALILPLRLRDQTLGLMHLAGDKPDDFGNEDGLKLQPLANAAVIAIQNARLVETLEAEVKSRVAEIHAEQEKSEIILRNVGSAIGMANLELQVQYVNEAFERLTGHASSEVVGSSPGSILFEQLSDQEQHLMQAVISRGEIWQREVVIARKDGRTIDAAVTVVPMHDAGRKLTGYVFSLEDISQRKELDRARSRFITIVSHELRTPATNMKLYAQLLQRDPPPEKMDQYLHTIHLQADRMSQLVQDILEITSLDSGQAVRTWAAVNVQSLLQDIVARYQDQAQAADLELRAIPVPVDLPVVQGDLVRLGQALAEIVENAVTFTPAGGRVTAKVEQRKRDDRNWVMITVRDTGRGIIPEEQSRIFDRFYRGSLAESGNVPGTGLGLSIAQVIMQAHGGRVTVESQVGCGSVFTLCLPAAPDQPEPSASNSDSLVTGNFCD